MDGNGYINGYGYGLMSDAVDEVLPLHCNDLDDGVLGSIPVHKKNLFFYSRYASAIAVPFYFYSLA